MARLLNASLGKPSGKLGDNVFRIMNGKAFISLRPDHYRPTKSEKLKAARKNFAAATSFAKSVNSVPALKEIWLNAKVQGTISFNRIMKANRNFTANGSLTTSNKITPDGFSLNVSPISVQDDQLDITIGLKQDTGVTFPLTLFLLFCFKNEKGLILNQTAMIENPSQNNSYTFDLTLMDEIQNALAKDPSPLVFTAATGMPVKNKVYWSSTFAVQL